MATLFVIDSKIATSLSPLGAMRRDAAPARAKLGEKMREFMSKRAIDFAGVIAQSRI